MMDIPAVHVYENDIFESYWYNMIDGLVCFTYPDCIVLTWSIFSDV